jgi:hypothetical protein
MLRPNQEGRAPLSEADELETAFRVESELDQLQRLRCHRCHEKASVSIYELRTKRSVALCAFCAGYSSSGRRPRRHMNV